MTHVELPASERGLRAQEHSLFSLPQRPKTPSFGSGWYMSS